MPQGRNQNQKNNLMDLKEFLNKLTYQVIVEHMTFLSEKFEILENLEWGVRSKMKKIRRVLTGKKYVGKFLDLKSLVSDKILERIKVPYLFFSKFTTTTTTTNKEIRLKKPPLNSPTVPSFIIPYTRLNLIPECLPAANDPFRIGDKRTLKRVKSPT